jgi:hypothetical protein
VPKIAEIFAPLFLKSSCFLTEKPPGIPAAFLRVSRLVSERRYIITSDTLYYNISFIPAVQRPVLKIDRGFYEADA